MMSSGEAPVRLMVSMMVCSLAPAGHSNMCPLPSCTCTFDSGVTTVLPWLNGAGWLTLDCSRITTRSAPCETAAALTVTPSAMTTVPVRELKTTRGSSCPMATCRSCRSATKPTRCVGTSGARTSMLVPSRVLAISP